MPRKQLARSFQVIFQLELDAAKGPAWIVTIPAVQGCHSWGRSLAEARRNIREALAVSLDDDARDAIAEAAEFEEDVRWPKGARAAARRLEAARGKAEAEAARLRAIAAAEARAITEQLSLRDAGELLGLSAEGVRKLLKAG